MMEGDKRSFRRGEIILRQGETGRSAYIIETGQVEIYYERSDGRIQTIGTRGPGTIVGEMAMIDEEPRVATVRALEDCRVLEITREDFSQHLESTDPVVRMITEVILVRFRDTLTRAEILHESHSMTRPESLERRFMARTDLLESVKTANRFRTALENDRLDLHYQPIVDLASGKARGLEALMRWTDPQLGTVPPSVFIPIAEENGLLREAARWVVRKACGTLARVESTLGTKEEMYISVNFSNQDFVEAGLAQWLTATVDECSIRPEQLVIEITERILIQEPDTTRRILQDCSAAGIGIAIDDFGTGYSSLSYLQYFPINLLKIDQSFIRSMRAAKRSLELVRSIVGLGKGLELHTIAEGVESVEESDLLREMGCESAQGYYFARPVPGSDVVGVLGGTVMNGSG